MSVGCHHHSSSPPNHSDEDQQQQQDSLTISSSNENIKWWDAATSSESPEAMQIEENPLPVPLVPETTTASLELGLQTHSLTNQFPTFDFTALNGLTSFQSSLMCGTPGQPSLSTSKVVPDIDKWSTSNNAFIFAISSGKKRGFEPRITNSLAAYKAILWGCDEVEEKERAHPFWFSLRQVDEKVFGNWTSKAQRVAMMFVTHRMLLVCSLA